MFYVYVIRTGRSSLYIGVTNELKRRFSQHYHSKGAKFTRDYPGSRPVFVEKYSTLIEARRRERQLKGWTRAKKEVLIRGDLRTLKQL